MAEEKNMSSDVMIQIRGLKKSYGKLQVLRGIDLDVKRGEKVVILGPSASFAVSTRSRKRTREASSWTASK